jgi:hypothetical protein
MHTWRAAYYNDTEDREPSDTKTFQAKDVDTAVAEALGFKSNWRRVELTITIFKGQSEQT